MASIETRSDLDEIDVANLSSLLANAWGKDELGPTIDLSWFTLAFSTTRDTVAFVQRKGDSIQFSGYAEVTSPGRAWTAKLATTAIDPSHPDVNRHDTLLAVYEHVRAKGGGHAYIWIHEPDDDEQDLCSQLGFVADRNLLQMKRSLRDTSDLAQTFSSRAFQVGSDEQSWLALNNAAFAHHPEQGNWTTEILRHHQSEPWFDPVGFVVFDADDGNLGASCWTKILPEDRNVGEIYGVAVRPDLQGQGLGKKIVRAGLAHLANKGCGQAFLYVDAATQSAVALYNSLGFVTRHVDSAFEGTVAPEVTSRYDCSQDEITEILADLPSYRTKQIWNGLYQRLLSFEEMTDLPRALRDDLEADSRLGYALSDPTEVHADQGATTKWLFRLKDKAAIETVLMHHERHSTVCVSSQAGCAMACTFCATGDAGFSRQLNVGEIVEQVIRAARAAKSHNRRLDHVVFMGMGEPFANLSRVLCAIDRIVDDVGLSSRHITVSTVGVVPGIRRITTYGRQINLAVSLHAANDALRDRLVPLNRRYPIATLIEACRAYVETTHRRLSFEWALIEGVNDRPSDAAELAAIAFDLHAHVNLIPLNPTSQGPARGLAGSSATAVRIFRDRLQQAGVNATVRRTRGRSIDAACGQLAAATDDSPPSSRRPLSVNA